MALVMLASLPNIPPASMAVVLSPLAAMALELAVLALWLVVLTHTLAVLALTVMAAVARFPMGSQALGSQAL
jgi:hypothetical protein